MSRFRQVFSKDKILIGVCHLPPLPDYPDSPGSDALCRHAQDDLATLEAAGFDAILIENEYDRPHRVKAEPTTVEAMTAVTQSVCEAAASVVVGCEILLNDPCASLDVCKASGARFIRSDYFIDRMSRPEYGEFEIDSEGLLEHRDKLGLSDVAILADIQVKFATMVEKRPLRESARMAALGEADAIVVTGDETGSAPTVYQLRDARAGVVASGRDVPVLLGSGLDTLNAYDLVAECDGAIVGTSLMRNRRIDGQQARALVEEIQRNS